MEGFLFVFFFKQNMAYEMRISDWSSDVCSSDLALPTGGTAVILADGTKGYANYVDGVVDGMVTAVNRLKANIDAGDLAKARAEYPVARVFYERIESDVEGFVLPGFKATDNAGNLDYLIDMRASHQIGRAHV